MKMGCLRCGSTEQSVLDANLRARDLLRVALRWLMDVLYWEVSDELGNASLLQLNCHDDVANPVPARLVSRLFRPFLPMNLQQHKFRFRTLPTCC
jgi:hypothetical protein